MSEKVKLRKNLIEIRKKLPHRLADYDSLSKNTYFKNAKTVCCYVSFGSEIDTLQLIEHILAEKTLCVPYCIDKNGNMIGVQITSLSDLKVGSFGILEPKTITIFDKTLIDVFIVPGLAFDKSGARIGFGKGYYDRFLLGTYGYKIGLCHKELLLDHVPTDQHDIKLNEIITF